MRMYKRMRERVRKLFEGTRILTVIGGYWGDEGKGKIIDAIAPLFDVIARFSGGANAGHTVCTEDGVKIVSHIIPCGIAQGKTCAIGPGVFFDMEAFITELKAAQEVIGQDNIPLILIDPNCPVRTPYHSMFEAWLEFCRGKDRINTTNKAIGPLAGFDALRNGIRVADLFSDSNTLSSRIFTLFRGLEPAFRVMHETHPLMEVPHPDLVTANLLAQASKVNPFVNDVPGYLRQALKDGARILAEGAQSVGLDRTFGTYPYVSSGLSTNLGAPQGLGIAPKHFDMTLLVAKSKPTRVGEGEFPSEIWSRAEAEEFPKRRPDLFGPDANGQRSAFLRNQLAKINNGDALRSDIAQYFQVLGDERGATTGRGRSVGHADWAWLQYAVETTGADMVALTRLDMLTGLDQIRYVYEYQRNTDKFSSLGGNPTRGNIAAMYELMPGWSDSISGATEWDQLPLEAQGYVNRMQECIGGIPISLIGTSPNRDGLIVRSQIVTTFADDMSPVLPSCDVISQEGTFFFVNLYKTENTFAGVLNSFVVGRTGFEPVKAKAS